MDVTSLGNESLAKKTLSCLSAIPCAIGEECIAALGKFIKYCLIYSMTKVPLKVFKVLYAGV